MTTPKVSAPELAESQADKEETVNEAVRRLEILAGLARVVDRDLTAPPGSCADGATYIVAGPSPTGAWEGHDGDLAAAVGTNASNGWNFVEPEEGVFAYAQDENVLLYFDTSTSPGTWTVYSAGVGALALDDLSDVDVPSPSDGQVLTYDTDSPAGWKAMTPTGGSLALGDLTDVDVPSPADGYVLTYDTDSPSGWKALPASAGASSITPNVQTGTTYTVDATDNGKQVIFTNASNVAVTLPQATGSFTTGWYAYFTNLGGGIVTITPTTSTVGGLATNKLANGASVLLVSDGTNYRIIPLGLYGGTTGGFSLSLQDGATAGGNARGVNAIDLQFSRSAAAQVASGNEAFVVGRRNTASNNYAVAMGNSNTASASGATAIGDSNTASNTGAVAMGLSNTASGYASRASGESVTAANNYAFAHGYSITGVGERSAVFGYLGHGNSNVSQFTWAAGAPGTTSQGSAQSRKNILLVYTTGSSAVRLTATGGAASSSNVMNLPNNTSVAFTATVIIRDLSNGNTNTYTIGPSLITRGANAASTAVSAGNPAVTVGPTTGTALTLAADPTFTADTTNGGINVSYTPPVGNTNALLAVCVIESVEVHV